MFGHVLRSNISSPAFLALKFAVCNDLPGRKGRHQSNLFNVLKKDLNCRNLKLFNENDLNALREISVDRAKWTGLF